MPEQDVPIEPGPGRLVYDKAKKSIVALRTPDASLARCPNTVRQSIADVIEAQQRQLDKYGLALMMIREGLADPSKFAAETLEKYPPHAAEKQSSGPR